MTHSSRKLNSSASRKRLTVRRGVAIIISILILSCLMLLLLPLSMQMLRFQELQDQKHIWRSMSITYYRVVVDNGGYQFPCPTAIMEVEQNKILSITAELPHIDLGQKCVSAYTDLTIDNSFSLAETYLHRYPDSVDLEYDPERGFITKLTVVTTASTFEEIYYWFTALDLDSLSPSAFVVSFRSLQVLDVE